jgi:hypothetical protein
LFSTKFVEQGRGLFFVGCGAVTCCEIYRAKIALAERRDLLRGVVFANVDFHETTELNVSPGDIRQLAHLDAHLARTIPNAIVAIVAPKDSIFGMARMWEVFAESTGWRTGVFRSSDEACAWVVQNSGVPVEA